MKGNNFIQAAVAVAILLFCIVSPVNSFVSTQTQYLAPSLSSSTWNNPRTDHGLSFQAEKASRSHVSLFAAKGTPDNKAPPKQPMVGYNDDAFGLIFLSGGLLSQDVDFVVTFVALSAIAAIFASSRKENNDTRLPGLVAMVTLVLTPVVAYTHNFTWAPPQPVEIGLCLVSLVWSLVKWSQEQKE